MHAEVRARSHRWFETTLRRPIFWRGRRESLQYPGALFNRACSPLMHLRCVKTPLHARLHCGAPPTRCGNRRSQIARSKRERLPAASAVSHCQYGPNCSARSSFIPIPGDVSGLRQTRQVTGISSPWNTRLARTCLIGSLAEAALLRCSALAGPIGRCSRAREWGQPAAGQSAHSRRWGPN